MILKLLLLDSFFHSFSSVDVKATHFKHSQFENANFAVIFRYTSAVLQTVHSTEKYYDDMYPDYVTGTPGGSSEAETDTFNTNRSKTKWLNVCLALKCMQIMFCH